MVVISASCYVTWQISDHHPHISLEKQAKMEENSRHILLSVDSTNHGGKLCGQLDELGSPEINSHLETVTAAENGTLKSPNVSTDSGFEGDNARPLSLSNSLQSPGRETEIWRNDVFHSEESGDDIGLLSPKSPMNCVDSAELINSSFIDQKGNQLSQLIKCQNLVDKKNMGPNFCGADKSKYIISGVLLSSGIEEIKGLSSKDIENNHCGEDPGSCDEGSSQTDNSHDGEYLGSCDEGSSHTDCSTYLNSSVYDSVHMFSSPARTSPDPVVAQALLSVRLDDGDYATPIDAIPFCTGFPPFRKDEDTDFEDSVSLLGAPVKRGDFHGFSCMSPPVRPPRGIRPLRIRKDETCSEASYSTSSGGWSEDSYGLPRTAHSEGNYKMASSSNFQGHYKSSRSRSEPSARYTTVVKPKPVRPPPVSLDSDEYRSSVESLHSGAVAIGQYSGRRSAFKEHLESSLSQNDVPSFFNCSLESPSIRPPSRSSQSQRSTSESPSVSRYSSTSDVTRGRTSQCPSSKRKDCSKMQAITISSEQERCQKSQSVLYARATEASSSGRISEETKTSSTLVTEQEVGAVGGDTETSVDLKRHSVPWDLFWASGAASRHAASNVSREEPIHMTLEEVRTSLLTLEPSPETITDSSVLEQEHLNNSMGPKVSLVKRSFGMNFHYKKSKKKSDNRSHRSKNSGTEKFSHRKSFPASVKAVLVSLFGFKKSSTKKNRPKQRPRTNGQQKKDTSPFMNRALPPLPRERSRWDISDDEEHPTDFHAKSEKELEGYTRKKMDYAASIQKVKDCGWYWGPISGETAEKLLASEPDGSFVVRDSSDEHYIFSLTFKLNGLVRHVRIEQDHGNFSFGCLQKFRSNTIVDFIENAVEHSRSGRYLFFLHRRPVLGPMRVQLLHPVSRFKQVQSLQHLCRFVILKRVRRDLIDKLPLPRRLRDYLNTPHYYSEELADMTMQSKKPSVEELPVIEGSSRYLTPVTGRRQNGHQNNSSSPTLERHQNHV
ncbi:uncharacterized protein LOC143222236 isoform X1 [Tachypleus tridentatus]|uniref:uncharacterized protein LOC143222236 isoform X1 n=2 Tax=Tachypleus tridentatus TaxID=6853 RepID=UPI003FD58DC7